MDFHNIFLQKSLSHFSEVFNFIPVKFCFLKEILLLIMWALEHPLGQVGSVFISSYLLKEPQGKKADACKHSLGPHTAAQFFSYMFPSSSDPALFLTSYYRYWLQDLFDLYCIWLTFAFWFKLLALSWECWVSNKVLMKTDVGGTYGSFLEQLQQLNSSRKDPYVPPTEKTWHLRMWCIHPSMC